MSLVAPKSYFLVASAFNIGHNLELCDQVGNELLNIFKTVHNYDLFANLQYFGPIFFLDFEVVFWAGNLWSNSVCL